MMTDLRVFLCHASGDKPAVRDLYEKLRSAGFLPWLDAIDLLPGQDWELEIRKAVKASHVVLICISPESISKTGFVQKEIAYALDIAEEQPEGTIFIIPVRLRPCRPPLRLNRWHYASLYEPGGFELLVRALNHRKAALGGNTSATSAGAPVTASRPLVSPRDPCPCGSGKRYGECHGRPREAGVRLSSDGRR